MRRTLFILSLLMLLGVGMKAQDVPAGAPLQYSGEQDSYQTTLDTFHRQQLNDTVYAWKRQHPYEGELRSYAFTVGPGFRRLRTGARHHGTKICLEEIDGRWVIDGYVHDREDTVAVDQDVVRHVEEMFGKLDFSILHPTFTEKDGEVVRTEVSDVGDEYLSVIFRTREGMFEHVPTMERYIQPEWAAKAYDALVKGILEINEYLWGRLKD